jgi:hypothetical protein
MNVHRKARHLLSGVILAIALPSNAQSPPVVGTANGLVQGVTLFFVAHLLLFLAALTAGLRVGIIYFLWIGIFNVMVIAQFWGFASDLCTPDQGKRLFPVIRWRQPGRMARLVRAGTVVRPVRPACSSAPASSRRVHPARRRDQSGRDTFVAPRRRPRTAGP